MELFRSDADGNPCELLFFTATTVALIVELTCVQARHAVSLTTKESAF